MLSSELVIAVLLEITLFSGAYHPAFVSVAVVKPVACPQDIDDTHAGIC